MPFPNVDRVIYNKNPLEQVICQLRFPPILTIDAELPAAFQNRVRKGFPNFRETTEVQLDVPPSVRMQFSPQVFQELHHAMSRNKNYEFMSEEGAWKINLTRSFIALSTNNYTQWEDFRQKLEAPLGALVDIYSPASYSRVGLRYVDLIRRSDLNLNNVSWNELLQPHMLGILHTPDVGSNVENYECRYEIRLSNNQSMVKMLTGTVEADDGEQCFVIDNDFFDDHKTSPEAVMDKLEYLRMRGSRLFQWCITERLHQAMEPRIL